MRPLRQRLRAAWSMVLKGSISPFNQIPLVDGGSLNSSQLDRPFEQSAWVMRAIKRVAEPISAVELEFYAPGNDGPLIDDPRLETFWAAPVLGADGQRLPLPDVIEAVVGWLKLKGEYFLLKAEGAFKSLPFPDVADATAAIFAPLILARPGCMQEVVRGGVLLAWRYTDDSGRTEILLPEQVLHRKNWNPYNPWRGLAEYEAARMAAETDRASAAFVRSIAENNNDTAPIVSPKSGFLDEEQRKQIDAQIRERRELARRGVYKTLFLSGEVSVSDPTIRAPDVAFVSQRLENRDEVAIAFGVPPSMFHLAASYSIGSASDRYLLIIETCQPASKKIAAGISLIASAQLGRPVEAWFNWDEHPVMQQVRGERITSAKALWDMGMPLAEASEYLDMGLPDFAGSEIGYLPFSVAPVGESAPASDPVADPAFAESESEGEGESGAEIAADVEKALRALRAVGPSGPEARSEGRDDSTSRPPDLDHLFACSCGFHSEPTAYRLPPTAGQRARPARELAQWRASMVDRRKSLRDYQAKIRGVLATARKETLQKLEAAFAGRAPAARLPADALFDQGDFRRSLLLRLRAAARSALQSAGEQVFAELKRIDPWSTPPPAVVDFIRQRENRLAGAADGMWEKVRDEIQAGIDAGDSTAAIAGRIKSTFNGLADDRALTIAQTEVAAAYGSGRDTAMREAGVQFKAWLTSGNDNVRGAHLQAGLDYPPERGIPLDEPFVVGGESLQFPGDPQGSPGNVINCHCVQIAVSTPEI